MPGRTDQHGVPSLTCDKDVPGTEAAARGTLTRTRTPTERKPRAYATTHHPWKVVFPSPVCSASTRKPSTSASQSAWGDVEEAKESALDAAAVLVDVDAPAADGPRCRVEGNASGEADADAMVGVVGVAAVAVAVAELSWKGMVSQGTKASSLCTRMRELVPTWASRMREAARARCARVLVPFLRRSSVFRASETQIREG